MKKYRSGIVMVLSALLLSGCQGKDVLNEVNLKIVENKVGEDIAQSLINEAYVLMQKEFDSNARYYDNAEKSAKRLIENIVKGLNNNVENLQVDVEFAE
ncbi:MAG: hypothetical protein UH654_07825 [Lachnospiraceae bacterium]|nr:hypothetical protein [Lachnospiraceae bacterium]MEE0959923.1 hypothetical protein [Lachnospiraceae bacterium]